VNRPLGEDHRRALAVLAENPDGCSRAVMLARGLPLTLLNRLVRAGLATSHLERAGSFVAIIRPACARAR
jgi:hypothetical protein